MMNILDKKQCFYQALSVVAPSGQKIAQQIKTIEVRTWKPESLPLKNLLIVENQHYLLNEGDEELGIALVLVDIEAVHPWREDERIAACANTWEDGYWAWEISNIRLIRPIQVLAKRKLYQINIALEYI